MICSFCATKNRIDSAFSGAFCFECYNCGCFDWISEVDLYEFASSQNISVGTAQFELDSGRVPSVLGEME